MPKTIVLFCIIMYNTLQERVVRMFVKKAPNKATGKTHLSIVQGYKDIDGKIKHRTIQKLGYLHELEKVYEDPVAHFNLVAKSLEKEQLDKKTADIKLDLSAQLDRSNACRKNYGFVVFSRIYHELEIDRFLNNARRHEKFKFNSEAIMRLLVYSRLLYPGSKRAAYAIKDSFFDNFDFSLYDVYDALAHYDKISERLQRHLHERVTVQYGRKTDLVYYDVTNYYFAIDRQDALRKKGPSKENRKSPIVQMGLFMDTLGLPISYRLFPGNTHDSQTMMPMMAELKKKFGVKRVISVADKGLNSGDNIAFCIALGDGYIYSKSIRGASEEFKKWVLDEKGYYIGKDKLKIKSKLVPDATIYVTVGQEGKKKKKKKMKVEQKWIVFYSEKYAVRAKIKREEAIMKARDMIANPSKYKSTFDYGAAGYIKNLKVDRETGEICNVEDTLLLDIQKIEEEEQYDGYYALVTSEMDDPDEHTVRTYNGLWKIEESFKVTKSVYKARPVYLSDASRINAHFLICFVSLLIGRIVELRLGGNDDILKICETLKKVSCTHLDQNIWLFDYASELTDKMNAEFGTDFGKKAMLLCDIKSALALSKKMPPLKQQKM